MFDEYDRPHDSGGYSDFGGGSASRSIRHEITGIGESKSSRSPDGQNFDELGGAASDNRDSPGMTSRKGKEILDKET